jgi:hypothetical protein
VDLAVVQGDGHPELPRVNRCEAGDVVSHRTLTDGRGYLGPNLLQRVLKIHDADCVLPPIGTISMVCVARIAVRRSRAAVLSAVGLRTAGSLVS